MVRELILEIGAEEIPAAFLPRALDFLETELRARLIQARLSPGTVEAMGTPRRVMVCAEQVPDKQEDQTEILVGPPARVALDKQGQYTKAAIGFANRSEVSLDALECRPVDGKQGEYLVCTVHRVGQSAQAILAELLVELVRSIPWAKSMRWGSGTQLFVRPVHWLLAMFGEEVVPVTFAGISSGKHTRGHRFLSPDLLVISGGKRAYVDRLREAFVIASPQVRKDLIAAELARVESETGCRVRPDPALIEEVTCLVEYPVAVCGEFDVAYLEVPEQVIVSAMRSHQRYFAMEDAQGKLANRFVTIAGTVTRDMEVVRRGNERVLAARLADARFFFEEDRKTSLDAMARMLDDVVFQSKLGSIGAKTTRIRANAAQLAPLLGIPEMDAIDRAASLCKADLVSLMVGEFPDLQGVMGERYARLAGEENRVCIAIREHYLPRFAGDRLPSTDEAAILSIADRLDTLVGCFAVGLAPTGSADPYGLRRAAVAILSIVLDKQWPVSLPRLIQCAADNLASGVGVEVTDNVQAQLLEFFRVRLRGVLTETHGLSRDCVDAVLSASYEEPVDVWKRAVSLSSLRHQPDFEPIAMAFKRVANILKGAQVNREPDPDKFVDPQEHALWGAYLQVRDLAADRLGQGDYTGSLQVLTQLKKPVDGFFEAVLVMAKEAAIRDNRLALLGSIHAAFARIADFRKLAV